MAPARPAPRTAVGIEAPAFDEEELSLELPELPVLVAEDEPLDEEELREWRETVELLALAEMPDDAPLIRVALPLAAVWITVAFAVVAMAVMFATAELSAALSVAIGTRYVLMSDGSAVNHVGVLPAANALASSLEAATELVRASWTMEDGRAVCMTERTDTLRLELALADVGCALSDLTYRSSDEEAACGVAKTDAARAETARSVYCILSKVEV
ncbi:hypothetical protein LTR08_008919 [Meristemomyces frigidus]|nr:hypothetical protein LTR08_008919 [Meristemomyces frigidus]